MINIEKFYPAKRELVVKYNAGPERICKLILVVANSGNYLELKRIERQEN